jgi:hypothetical protein
LKRFLTLALALLGATIAVSVALAATGGTWEAYPGQSTTYQATVQQPINVDGSSNWPAKSKGGIPLMFKLSSGLGPLVFESICSDNTVQSSCTGGNTANDYSYVSFTPTAATTFNDITDLAANYTFTLGNCHGGSLRWSIRTSPTQSVFIYYGDLPNFTDCTTNSQTGTNMVGLSDLRYDTSQYIGGTFYDSYAHAQTLVGTTPIVRASLVLDSGWGGDQRLTLGSATVNDNTFTPQPPSAFAATCDLPPATLKVTKTSGVGSGDVNETTVVQNFDSGNAFRVVDCKYQYVLAIPSLNGAGGYKAEIQIAGNTVGAALFDLK